MCPKPLFVGEGADVAHPYHHARSSARKFGGSPEVYEPIHAWFDRSKAHVADATHRVLRHTSFGIFLAEMTFGVMLQGAHRKLTLRPVGEQHVTEDLGQIPSLHDCLRHYATPTWLTMNYAFDTPGVHAEKSAEAFGGKPEAYLQLHATLESARHHVPDARHRVFLHSGFGVETLVGIYGETIPVGGRDVSVRQIAEHHIETDLGFVPSAAQLLETLPLEPWMYLRSVPLSRDPDLSAA